MVVKAYLSDSHDLTAGPRFPFVKETDHGVNFRAPLLVHGAWVESDHRSQRVREPVHKGEHGLPFRTVDVRLKQEVDPGGLRPADVVCLLSGIGPVTQVAMCVYEYHGAKDSEIHPKNENIQLASAVEDGP